MKSIFFIRDSREYDLLRKRSLLGDDCSDLIFGYSPTPPFLSEKLYYISNVAKWEDHVPTGVLSESIWLKEYRSIEETVGRFLSASKKEAVFNNKFFMFGMVKDYGDILRECSSVFFVLKKYRPGNIYIDPNGGMFSDFISSFGNDNGIGIKNI